MNKKLAIALTSLFLFPLTLCIRGQVLQYDTCCTARPDPGLFMPRVDWQMAGLDVRDTLNQQIRDAAQVSSLTDLFLQNLLNLTIVAPPHAMSQILAGVDAFLSLLKGLFF